MSSTPWRKSTALLVGCRTHNRSKSIAVAIRHIAIRRRHDKTAIHVDPFANLAALTIAAMTTPLFSLATRTALAALSFAVALPLTAFAADSNKTLRLAFSTAETSYDNTFTSDEVSQSIGERIIEPICEVSRAVDYAVERRPVHSGTTVVSGL